MRTAVLVLMLLLSTLLVASPSWGDELIGGLSDMWGGLTPPISNSGTFFSPTRFIKLYHDGAPGPNASGMDRFHIGCDGETYHVIASCRVNDFVVPYADHRYDLTPGGYCIELYDWRGVEVDLGAPGWFTIEVVVDNTLHIGEVAMYGWDIYTVGPPPPPFEILSATFDDDEYQSGVDTAHLTVVSKSNWGASSGMSLQATLDSNFGDIFDVGTDSFSLEAGGEHVSQLSWPVAGLEHPFECNLRVVLRETGEEVARFERDGALAGMLVTEEEVAQVREQMQQSNCLPPDQACAVSIAGAVPYVGILPDLIGYADDMCQVGEAFRSGNYRKGAVKALGALFSATMVVLDVLEYVAPPIALVELYVPQAVGIAKGCAEQAMIQNAAGQKGQREDLGTLVDSVAADVRTGFEEIQREFSNEVFVGGPAKLRVGVDGRWTDMDSLGITQAFVFGTRGDTLKWAHVGPQPKRFGGEENPLSAIDVEVRGQAEDTLDVGFLHRDGGGAVLWFRYEPFAVTGQSVARLAVSDTSTTYSLSVDYDGDGGVDFVLYPEGTSGVEDHAARPDGAVLLLETAPNPTTGSTALLLRSPTSLKDVRISVYDVAGREVRRLSVGDVSLGANQVIWDGRDQDGRRVTSGIYLCVATHAGSGSTAKRLVVLK